MNKVNRVTTITFWVIGLPLSFFAMVVMGMGLEGIWFGLTLANILNYIIFKCLLHLSDWSEIAEAQQDAY